MTETVRPRPLVYVVVLNWNGLKDTLDCVESLRLMTYVNFRILVVDNGSKDNSVEVLSQIEGVRLVANAVNLGFTGGNNAAMRIAFDEGADYAWLLNNDATAEPDCLEKLVAAAEADSNIGLVSPVLYEADDPECIQHCASRFDLSNASIEEAASVAMAEAWQRETPYRMCLWGTALLVSRVAADKVGLLDERLFAYSEDTDYSIRMCRAGYRNVVALNAKVWHRRPAGLRKPHYYYYVTRNDSLCWPRHVGWLLGLKKRWWNLHRTMGIVRTLTQHPELVAACMAGLWHGWRGVGGPYDPSARMPSMLQRVILKVLANDQARGVA